MITQRINMIIEISINNKHKIIEFPEYFEKYENGNFKRCYTKEQFDFLKNENYETHYMFFDFKKKIIYFHEWCESELTGDCDYAWSCAWEYKKKVFNIWSN